MSEVKISRQLAKLEEAIKTVELGPKKSPGKEITYTGLDGNNKGKAGLKATYLVGTIADDSRKLLASLKVGDQFVIVKQNKPGEKWWNVTGFETAEGYTPKEPWTGGKAGAAAPKKDYDQTGVKVGAARNQAIAYLTATKGGDFTLDDVDFYAYEIVLRQQKQEDAVRSGKTQAAMYSANAPELEQMDQDLDADDDLPF